MEVDFFQESGILFYHKYFTEVLYILCYITTNGQQCKTGPL